MKRGCLTIGDHQVQDFERPMKNTHVAMRRDESIITLQNLPWGREDFHTPTHTPSARAEFLLNLWLTVWKTGVLLEPEMDLIWKSSCIQVGDVKTNESCIISLALSQFLALIFKQGPWTFITICRILATTIIDSDEGFSSTVVRKNMVWHNTRPTFRRFYGQYSLMMY